MNLNQRLMQAYFDSVYNRVYDMSTARLNRYQKLLEYCVDRVKLEDNDLILCVGIGTGNEALKIFGVNRNVSVIGVDYSKVALGRAYKKLLASGNRINVMAMDAQQLGLVSESFDKVLCVHVIDFVEEDTEVTKELLRVLKQEGQFVITYPSGKENLKLGINLLRDSIRHKDACIKRRVTDIYELLLQLVTGIAYLPLLLRSGKRYYSLNQLNMMIDQQGITNAEIEEDSLYRDFVVHGRK